VAFTRITVDPAVMRGMSCLRGLRVPLVTLVSMVTDGMSAEELLTDLPYVVHEDIAEALRFAVDAVRERDLQPLPGLTWTPCPART